MVARREVDERRRTEGPEAIFGANVWANVWANVGGLLWRVAQGMQMHGVHGEVTEGDGYGVWTRAENRCRSGNEKFARAR